MNQERIWNLVSKKLAGELTEAELRELEELLRENPDMHYSIQNIQDIWALEPRAKRPDPSVFERHIQKMTDSGIDWNEKTEADPFVPDSGERSQRNSRFGWLLGKGAMVVLFVISAIWLYNHSNITFSTDEQNKEIVAETGIHKNEISTHNGSKTKISLPDGSEVWLNAGSKLNYPGNFGNEIREVELTGEGYFNVVRNPNRPFIIHTPVVDIRVLGTQFNVKSYPTDRTTETSLIHGKVEVMVRKRPNEKYILKPNEKLVVLNEESGTSPVKLASRMPHKEPLIAIRNLTYQTGDSNSVETAWTYNKLSFEDEAFGDVAQKMERWYDVEIHFKNPELQEIHMKGSFTNETLQQAMEALQYSGKFRYEIRNREVIIY